MTRLRTGERADRVLRFINGLRNPRIAAQVAQFGFSQKDLDQGWTLMRQSVGERLLAAPSRVADPHALDLLDSWENTWFPVAQASLGYEYPAVGEKVFLNIGRTTGVAVIISVGTFIERFDALATGSEEEKAAHALLASRGLDERTVRQAKDLLDELRSVEPMPVPNPEEMKRKQAEADAALWGWYKQWGAIARVAIKRGDYLRQLGFGVASGSPTPEPELDIDVDPSPPAV